MAFKTQIKSLNEVDEAFQPHYKAVPSGGYVLDIDGTPEGFMSNKDAALNANKVVEFRNTNIDLIKEVEELRPLKIKFEGIDADEAKAAIAKVKELGDKGVKKAGDVEDMMSTMLAKFTKDVVDPLKVELADEKTARNDADSKVNAATMRSQFGERFLKMGGEPGALSFVIDRAEAKFEVTDGQTVAKANVFSTDNPGAPLCPDEWLTAAAADAETSFAFKKSNGGGSEGDKTPKHKAGVKELVNPSPEELGANMDAIVDGTMRVVEQAMP